MPAVLVSVAAADSKEAADISAARVKFEDCSPHHDNVVQAHSEVLAHLALAPRAILLCLEVAASALVDLRPLSRSREVGPVKGDPPGPVRRDR